MGSGGVLEFPMPGDIESRSERRLRITFMYILISTLANVLFTNKINFIWKRELQS